MATKIDFTKEFEAVKSVSTTTSSKPVVKQLFAIVPAFEGVTVTGDFKNMFVFELEDGSFGFSMTSLNQSVEVSRIELTNLFLMTKSPESFEFKGKTFHKYSSRSVVAPKPVTQQTAKNDLPFEV